jgi:hypothetical protein
MKRFLTQRLTNPARAWEHGVICVAGLALVLASAATRSRRNSDGHRHHGGHDVVRSRHVTARFPWRGLDVDGGAEGRSWPRGRRSGPAGSTTLVRALRGVVDLSELRDGKPVSERPGYVVAKSYAALRRRQLPFFLTTG